MSVFKKLYKNWSIEQESAIVKKYEPRHSKERKRFVYFEPKRFGYVSTDLFHLKVRNRDVSTKFGANTGSVNILKLFERSKR